MSCCKKCCIFWCAFVAAIVLAIGIAAAVIIRGNLPLNASDNRRACDAPLVRIPAPDETETKGRQRASPQPRARMGRQRASNTQATNCVPQCSRGPKGALGWPLRPCFVVVVQAASPP